MQVKTKYKNIFFDLDHTLWDFEKNSTDTLLELYRKYELKKLNTFCENTFVKQFQEVNARLWRQSDEGKVDRETLRTNRFRIICQGLDLHDEEVAVGLGKDYVTLCPQKKELKPFATEVLEYLDKKYELYILTNGYKDVQAVKLQSAGVLHYFKRIFTAEDAGIGKPEKAYFRHVLGELQAEKNACIMIGDNLKTDILGAQNSGIDHIYYNPGNRTYFMPVQHEIKCLSELKSLL